MPEFSPIFPFFLHCRLCSWNVSCLRHRNKLMYQTVMAQRIYSSCSDVIFVIPVRHTFQSYSHGFVGIDNTSVFCLAFPNVAVGFPTAFYRYFLQGLAAGIGTSNFLRAACIVSLNSSSFGSMKNIALNCLALSSFGFSIAHLCFAFFFGAPDICFHISGHTLCGLEVVCFLVSLLPDHVHPSGVLSFNNMNLVKPVNASDNSFSQSTFQ